jgi:hypothetical protein
MPNVSDVVAHKLECARTELHSTYNHSLRTLGAEPFFSVEDRELLDKLDKRLFDLAQRKTQEIEHSWRKTSNA